MVDNTYIYKHYERGQDCDLNMIRGICMNLSEFVKHIQFLYKQIMLRKNKSDDYLKNKWKSYNDMFNLYDPDEEEEEDDDLAHAFDNWVDRDSPNNITQFYFDLISIYYRIDFNKWAQNLNISIISNPHVFCKEEKIKNGRHYQEEDIPLVFLGLVESFEGFSNLDQHKMIKFWQSDLSLLSQIFKEPVQNWAINFECFCCR